LGCEKVNFYRKAHKEGAKNAKLSFSYYVILRPLRNPDGYRDFAIFAVNGFASSQTLDSG
jgi:hypothetical protein